MIWLRAWKKYAKTKPLSGCLCILFARNPEIFSGIQVGKRMEWWIIPKGNLMEVAATDGGMYRTAWKDYPFRKKDRNVCVEQCFSWRVLRSSSPTPTTSFGKNFVFHRKVVSRSCQPPIFYDRAPDHPVPNEEALNKSAIITIKEPQSASLSDYKEESWMENVPLYAII